VESLLGVYNLRLRARLIRQKLNDVRLCDRIDAITIVIIF